MVAVPQTQDGDDRACCLDRLLFCRRLLRVCRALRSRPRRCSSSSKRRLLAFTFAMRRDSSISRSSIRTRAPWILRHSRSLSPKIPASGIRSSSLLTALSTSCWDCGRPTFICTACPLSPKIKQGVFLLGTDRLGRDMFSRMCYGARLSLSMGMISVFLSLVLGVVLGGISGYFGGKADVIIQRVIEFIRTIPTIPLYMTLSRGAPGQLARRAGVLWHHDDPCAGRVDLFGARGARAIPGDARGGLCARRPVERIERDAHHPAPHGALLSRPTLLRP